MVLKMSPEERECILRLVHLLRNEGVTYGARELVRECTKDDLLGRYKRHSSATVYKAINYLAHYSVIQKTTSPSRGRGRPPMVYKLRRELSVSGNEVLSFGEDFADIMFKHDRDLESALNGYKANLGVFVDVLLISAIVERLKTLPLASKREAKALERTLEESIDLDVGELGLFAKSYVRLILKEFGAKHRERSKIAKPTQPV